MLKSKLKVLTAVLSLAAAHGALGSEALGTGFTYQGQLALSGEPVNDTADMVFRLWDAETSGNLVGAPVSIDGIVLIDGVFSAELDFGANVFNGEARWLEIDVASPSGEAFSTLSPRQALTAAPYALKVPGIDGHSLDAADGSSEDVVYVDDSGWVGIGTTTPSTALDVAGTVNANAFVGDGSQLTNLPVMEGVWSESDEDIYFDGGFVGICTSLPTAELEVAGDIVVSSGYQLLDQYQPSIDFEESSDVVCQSFTAGSDGVLTQIRLWIGGDSTDVAGSLRLYRGEISPTTLFFVKPVTISAGSPQWMSFPVSSQPVIEAGSPYTFEIVATSGTMTFGLGDLNPYSGGDYCSDSAVDVTFETYIGSRGDVYAGIFYGDGSGLTNLPVMEGVWSENDTDIYFNGGNVGVGTDAPTATLDVAGDIVASPGNVAVDQANDQGLILTFDDDIMRQSFTAGVSGVLTALEMRINNSTTAESATLSIFEGSGTGGSLLVSQPLSISSFGWVTIEMEEPPTLEADMQYTFQVQTDTGTVRYYASIGNHYPDGALLTGSSGDDLAFRTYMGEQSTVTAGHFVGDGSGLTNLPLDEPVWTESGSDIYFDSGNVGIGTDAPEATLEVVGDTRFTEDDPEIVFYDRFGTNGNRKSAIRNTLQSALGIDGAASQKMSFHVSNGGEATMSQVMTLQGNGNVGIGTASPSAKLDVVGTVNADGLNVEAQGDGARLLTFTNERPWAFEQDGSGSAASLRLRNISVGNKHLFVDTDGRTAFRSADGATEAVHIEHSTRQLGVGRTPTNNALEVEGDASKSSAGSWLANSDRRIKTDIRTIDHALDTLDRVRLVSFEYTDDYKSNHAGIGDGRYLNVIAQEFAEVFPDHVKGSGELLPDGSEILQVDTYPLTIYSAAAIQELRAEKDAEIALLRAEFERRIAHLEAIIANKGVD